MLKRALLVAGAVLAAGQAQAAMITQGYSFGGYADTGSFALFDPSLGQLNEVISSFTIFEAPYRAFDGPFDGTAGTITTTATGFLITTVGTASFDEVASYTVNGGIGNPALGVSSVGGADFTSSNDLRYFVGVGQGLVLPVAGTFRLTVETSGNFFEGRPEFRAEYERIQGTLTYVYDAGAVPEPATWAMMVGGFGVIGAAMRRRPSRLSYR